MSLGKAVALLLTYRIRRRAGRFGTKGLAITFVSSPQDTEVLQQIQGRFEVKVTDLPDTIDASTYSTSFCTVTLGLFCLQHSSVTS